MEFIFKWFVPSWLKRPLLEMEYEREYREDYYARELHEVEYKSVMTELLKKTRNRRNKLNFQAKTISVHHGLMAVIAEKRYERSLKQKKHQIEYGRLENWLTKVEKYKDKKKV